MPADTKSKHYKEMAADWLMVRTVLAGEKEMKQAGETYLPKLSGQSKKDYDAYISRGTFFNATSRTVQGLTGAVVRKEASIEVADELMERLEYITVEDESIYEVIRKTIENILSYGYYGLLVDLPDTKSTEVIPYIACYECLAILNFKVKMEKGKEKLMMITLSETIAETDPDDPFATISKDIIRCLFIDDDGFYKQRLYEKLKEEWVQLGEDIIPTIRGLMIDYIPFIFVNATSTGSIPSKPPMLDLARINVKHWQVFTDYFHGLHYCAIPTPWAAGFNIKDNLVIGAQKAWVADDPQAKCGFLEFSGAGLSAVERGLDKLENMMAIMGARFLEEQKKAVEAADTHRMRMGGDTATLSSIVTSVERATEKTINIISEWMGIEKTSEVSINKEFVSEKLSAQDLTALLQSVQAGKISMETFLYNLQSGEILPPNRTIEEEVALIDKDRDDAMERMGEFQDAMGTNGQPGQPGNNQNQNQNNRPGQQGDRAE